MNCRRCSKLLHLHEDGKTWMSADLRVTCPTGGPHMPQKVDPVDWDKWEDTLDKWKKDVL